MTRTCGASMGGPVTTELITGPAGNVTPCAISLTPALHSAPRQAAQQFLAALARDRDGPFDALALIRLGLVIVIAPSLVPGLTPPVM